MLRQPKSVSKQEKYAFVEEVIKMLNMQDYADAIVGVPGEGLNVEQRKLLTIGVELAAKPKLLLFLDEPTSGLDSQSSWAICSFLRKLANSGQAVLCTVHQPSAILFQQFDRLLFLAKGGKTVYFGNIGEDSRTLLDYFQQHGARACDKEENPAEYILEVISNVTNNKGEDWHSVWKGSEEHQAVETEIDRIHAEKQNEAAAGEDEASSQAEFAMPFFSQLQAVSYRVFQQYWRMPAYIFAKFMLGIVAGLFIGFSFFQSSTSLAGMQNVIFSVFLLTTIFTTLVQQVSQQADLFGESCANLVVLDYPKLCHSTGSLRSQRTAKQGILMESLYHRQHHRRDPIPSRHGRSDLELLLLPRRRHPELRQTSPRSALCH